jgi:hypothetical protein
MISLSARMLAIIQLLLTSQAARAAKTDFSTDFRFEFFEDLFWQLSLYANYDSDPISLRASGSDYGIVSAIAYKF